MKINSLFVLGTFIALAAVSCAHKNDRPDHVMKGTDAGYYLVDESDDRYDIVNLFITTDDVFENGGDFMGVGKAFWLDLNITKGTSGRIPGGVYTVRNSEPGKGEPWDYILWPGEKYEDGLVGSFVYDRPDERTIAYYRTISSGSVRISYTGDVYAISGTISDGVRTYRFEYAGEVSFMGDVQNGGDNSDGDGPGDGPGDDSSDDDDDFKQITTETFSHGQIGYYGNMYEEQPSDVVCWIIDLAESGYNLDDYSGYGESLMLELFSASGSTTDIPSGRYDVDKFISKGYVPFAAGDGYVEEIDSESYCSGTWFFDAEGLGLYAATGGYVDISRNGSDYLISYRLEDAESKVVFSGNYNGPLKYYDGTKASRSAVKRQVMTTGVHSSAARKGNSDVGGIRPSAFRN